MTSEEQPKTSIILRRFSALDIRHLKYINEGDPFIETYQLMFYLYYLRMFPKLCQVAVDTASNDKLVGYVMGRIDGEGMKRHGHVTAIAVAAPYRRLGIAKSLMAYFEAECEADGTCWYIDLFVRPINQVAVEMYKKFGFVIHKRILGYYSGKDPEDAFDMRKSLSKDQMKTAMIPLKEPVHVDDVSD